MQVPPQQNQTTQNQKVFNDRYIVKKKISSGSFGVVFFGFDKINKEEVAIKLEKEENQEIKTLDKEVQILSVLQNTQGVPKFHWAGQEQDYNIMIIQLLGKDLAYYMKQLKRFSLKTVLLIGIQAIPLLERIHMKGVVHRDLKPENILMGKENEEGTLYIVDFGISKFYKNSNGQHMQLIKLHITQHLDHFVKIKHLLELLGMPLSQRIKDMKCQGKMISNLYSSFSFIF